MVYFFWHETSSTSKCSCTWNTWDMELTLTLIKQKQCPLVPFLGPNCPRGPILSFSNKITWMVNQEEMDPNFSFTNVPPEQTIYLLSARKTIRQSFSYLLGFYITKYYKKTIHLKTRMRAKVATCLLLHSLKPVCQVQLTKKFSL